MNRNAVGAASSREREGNSVESEDPVIAAGSRSHGIDIRFGAFQTPSKVILRARTTSPSSTG